MELGNVADARGAEPVRMNQELYGVFISYRRALIEAAARIVGSRESAEDVVQDTFVKLFDQEKAIVVRYPVSYLFQTVRNLAIDRHRHNEVENRHVGGEEEGLLVTSEAASPENVMLGQQALSSVMQALASLPERTQWAFEMYRFRGVPQKDIAVMLNVSPTLVNFMIRDALTCCRDALFGADNTADASDVSDVSGRGPAGSLPV